MQKQRQAAVAIVIWVLRYPGSLLDGGVGFAAGSLHEAGKEAPEKGCREGCEGHALRGQEAAHSV
jgi:hypothetical protein